MHDSQIHFSSPSSSRIEWGPAHHRDEATQIDVEPADRPDDN